ncbi:MAG: hypothetical protein F4X64_00180 [Chloroflexi bacterium]|nr:hypothetical protein [Chloroflexota bacterium]
MGLGKLLGALLLGALVTLPAPDSAAADDYRPETECVPALTDHRGRMLSESDLRWLRAFYAQFGIDTGFLDFDYAIQGAGFRWLADEPLIAVWAHKHEFDGYIRFPKIGPGLYDLAPAPRGAPLAIIAQGADGWPVCTISRIFL